jgi:hypothetical protein
MNVFHVNEYTYKEHFIVDLLGQDWVTSPRVIIFQGLDDSGQLVHRTNSVDEAKAWIDKQKHDEQFDVKFKDWVNTPNGEGE